MSDNQNRPRGRKRNITGQASEIKKQDQSAGTGPVGNAGGYQNRTPFGSSASGAPQSPSRPSGSQSPQSPSRPSGSQGAPGPFAAPSSSQQARRPVVHQSPRASGGGTRAAGSSGGGTRATGSSSGKPKGCLPLIILAVVALLGGGGMLSGLFGGGSNQQPAAQTSSQTSQIVSDFLGGSSSSSSVADLLGGTSSSSLTDLFGGTTSGSSSGSSLGDLFGGSSSGSSSGSSLGDLFGGSSSGSLTGGSSSGSVVESLLGSGSWYSMFGGADSSASSVGVSADESRVNTRVASGSRDKYTVLKGSGKDKVTILVYMCGADLESRSGMATRDIQEMLSASFSTRVNLLLYTGGSTRWRNNYISGSVNQIWQVKGGKLTCLEKDMGTASMTKPETLLSFLQYGAKNFKANRYQLILWDHGCGSVNGYGYDERNKSSGSMSLAGIDSALKASGMKFDFIGYDACLMATVENALMLSDYADYLIASEESEPGIGWYYTNWLTALGKNTSMSTLEIGKTICDDFTAACRKSCPGQTTTLSVVDLAELAHTVPKNLASFSSSITGLIEASEYTSVSNARNGSREFAAASGSDMVDLTDLATKMGNAEGKSLADALKEAVKYNRASVTNAYGLSIYFPYRKISGVDKAVSTYAAIGMDESYSEAIRAFASVEGCGQAASSQSGHQIPSILFGGSSSSSSGYSSSGAYGNSDLISSLLSGFLGGGGGNSGLGFLSGRNIDPEKMAGYVGKNMIDPSQLVFKNGVLTLSAQQWALIHSVDLNIFYDDGAGYIDLGLDQVFEWTPEGNLKADLSGAWLALNGQICPFYRTSSSDDGTNWSMNGYIPVKLNGWQAQLLVTFDSRHEYGYIAGARFVYPEGETETEAKALTELQEGDEIRLLCDYYSYTGAWQSSHELGDPITVGKNGLQLTDLFLHDPSRALITYRLTDIYHQAYWTAPLKLT